MFLKLKNEILVHWISEIFLGGNQSLSDFGRCLCLFSVSNKIMTLNNHNNVDRHYIKITMFMTGRTWA